MTVRAEQWERSGQGPRQDSSRPRSDALTESLAVIPLSHHTPVYLAHAILDGTLVPIDRVTNQRSYYSGEHRRRSVNVQVLAEGL